MRSSRMAMGTWVLSVGVLGSLGPSLGVGLELEPSISLGEVYTTNVTLAPSGPNKEDAWVTRVAPRLTAKHVGRSFEFDLDYTLEGLFYPGDSSRNAVYNQLGSVGLLDLFGKDLQLRAQGTIAQVNVSPEKPVTTSNIFVTGNRTEGILWDVGPQWRRKFWQSEVSGYVRYGKASYDSQDTQDIDTLSGRFSLHSDKDSPRVVTYDVAYQYDRLDYQISGVAVTETAYLQLGYRITPEFEVFGLGGVDNNFTSAQESTTLSETRWEVGAKSGLATSHIEAAVGHRFFGTTYRFRWDQTREDLTYHVSYSEDPSTTDLATLRQISTVAPGGTPVTPPPDPGLGRPGTLDRFIMKRAEAVAEWKGYRSRMSGGLFWEDRVNQVPPADQVPGIFASNDKSYGVQGEFDWDLGPRSLLRILGSWRHRNLTVLPDQNGNGGGVEVDHIYYFSAGLNYKLGARTAADFQLGYDARTGSAQGTNDYDQFLARAEITRRF